MSNTDAPMFDGIKNEAGEKEMDCIILPETSGRVPTPFALLTMFKGANCCKRTLVFASEEEDVDENV